MSSRKRRKEKRAEPSPPRRRRVHKPPGTSPGTLAIHPQAARPELRLIVYDGVSGYAEHHPSDLREIAALVDPRCINWLDVRGLGDVELIRGLGECYGLHPLALEDAVSCHHSAKTETYDDHVFFIARMPEPGPGIDTSQISLFVKQGLVITFQETPADPFEPVRERLRRGGPRLRTNGADYLAYALIDAVIDAYLPVLESYGDLLQELEDRILECPEDTQLAELHQRRRELIALRKAAWPHRDAIQALVHEPPPPFTAATQVFLRDCYDHTLRIIDLLETYREQSSSLMEVYLSSIGQRTNEVMKVLTVIATLFMPLSFLAGLYGMNFDRASPWNMPELGWHYGYPLLLAAMLAVVAGFFWFFRRRGWF